MVEFILNNAPVSTDKPTGSLLLDFIRYSQNLCGTKIGCREGDCGACNVLIGNLIDKQVHYEQVTSCLTPLGNVHGKHVVTIEGLNMDSVHAAENLSTVQRHMTEQYATQCGFCTPGFVVSLTAHCLSYAPDDQSSALTAIDGNICRCTGYKSIERAALKITEAMADKPADHALDWLITRGFIPSWFKKIPKKLAGITPIADSKTGAVKVGGGTDLYVQKPEALEGDDVDLIANRPSLRFIKIENGICSVGGGTTVTDMLESKEFSDVIPHLATHIKLISSSPIRNISTIAGNFVNASPIGDLTAFFLALNAQITLLKEGHRRCIPLKHFYRAYKEMDLLPGEIIEKVSFQVPPAGVRFNLEKVSKRIHLDIASVNSAAQIGLENNRVKTAHISAGGVGPIPLFLTGTCEFLKGRELNTSVLLAAEEILQREISPISDIRGSEAYKRLLLRQLFFAHFTKMFPDHIPPDQLIAQLTIP